MLKGEFNQKAICIILGGGAGSRLYPLTKHRSKPAVPVAGKYRLIDIPISICLNSGLKRMFVLTQFNSASLNKHITNTFNFDIFSDAFVDILAAEQTRSSNDWFQGTADAVRKTAVHLKQHEFDHIVILSGDHLYHMDLFDFMTKHVQENADISIGTIPVKAEEASAFGIMKVGKNSQIDSFTEKPSIDVLPQWTSEVSEAMKREKRHYLASMGIYIFKRSVLKELIFKYEDAIDFGKEIIPKSLEEGMNVVSYPFEGYWSDIGDIRSFFDANIALTESPPLFKLFEEKSKLYTRPRLLPPSKLINCKVNNAIIAEGCLIRAKEISHSVIGIRSNILEDTIVRRTYILGHDYYPAQDEMVKGTEIFRIGRNCHIENAIIDKHVLIGDNVSIVGHDGLEDIETEHYSIRKGIVVVHKFARIPDDTVIGYVSNSNIV